MTPMPTAVLRHAQRTDTHYDWLLPDPADPAGRLWTARVTVHPMHWLAVKAWLLTPIPPHRRFYLDYQGQVSGDRGQVVRVDEGLATILDWRQSHRVVTIDTNFIAATVALTRCSPTLWQAAIL